MGAEEAFAFAQKEVLRLFDLGVANKCEVI
jgi:hypothetical protein